MKIIVLCLFGLVFGAAPALAEPASDPGPPGLSVAERYSYAMGVRLAQLLKIQGVSELDSAAFAAAIDDVLAGYPLRFSEIDMQAAIREQQRLFGEQRAQRARDNLEQGQRFLAQHAAGEGVQRLPSGVQYRVLQPATGEQPRADDSVRVHYHGTLLDGSVFDSSVERGQPAEFALAGVIPGFREALSQMRVGEYREIVIPSELAYGEPGAGTLIGPNETLRFQVQLLDILR